MKKILVFVLSVCMVCGFSACSSDNDELVTVQPTWRAKKLVAGKASSGSTLDEIVYDAQGRVAKVAVTDSYSRKQMTYNYSSQIIERVQFENGRIVDKVKYILDSKGRIILKGSDTDTITYVYDSQNQLVQTIHDGEKFHFTWSGGNVIRYVEGDDDYAINYAYTDYAYTNYDAKGCFAYADYSLEFIPRLDGWVDHVLFMQGYFGNFTKNFLKSVTSYDGVSTYEYEVDADGYVTKVVNKNNGNTATFTWK